jgi:hypothetical protein
MSDRRYWVVGGKYSCLEFKTLESGSQTILGPFDREEEARSEWKRISFENKSEATTRYSIVAEGAVLGR